MAIFIKYAVVATSVLLRWCGGPALAALHGCSKATPKPPRCGVIPGSVLGIFFLNPSRGWTEDCGRLFFSAALDSYSKSELRNPEVAHWHLSHHGTDEHSNRLVWMRCLCRPPRSEPPSALCGRRKSSRSNPAFPGMCLHTEGGFPPGDQSLRVQCSSSVLVVS